MGHVFISYSHKDTKYAHRLAESLQNLGIDVWIDERLDYGSQWPLEIQKQLDTCDAFILIMSPRSFASDWVQSELQRAKRKMKPIFPLLLEGDEPWLSVESTQYYDVRGKDLPDNKFYSALRRVVSIGSNDRTYAEFSGSPKAKHPLKTPSPGLSTGILLGVGGFGVISILCVVIMLPLLSKMLNPAPTPIPPTAMVITATNAAALEAPVLVSATSVLSSIELPSTPTSVAPPTMDIPPAATFTSTPVPPTSTPIPTATPKRDTSIYIEAENGKLVNGAYVENDSTASKNSFVNFSAEGTLKFTLRNMKTGQYSLVIHYLKYANGTNYPNTGFQNLYVNNDSNPISIYYTKTFGDGDAIAWNDTSLTISLEDGTNTLLIAVMPGSVGASIDYIYLSIN